MKQWALVFFSMAALDLAYAGWTKHLMAKRHAMASAFAAVIIMLSGVGTIAYTHDTWMLIPAALGAACGTYVASSELLTRACRALWPGET